jgi:quercetin dioxygenase-like cupin family protein
MKRAVVIYEEDCPFRKVAWGVTKGLVAAESSVYSDNVQVRITEYEPFFEHSMHVHPDQEEIIFVLSGGGYSVSEEGRQELRPGAVAYVPAGVHHATVNPNAEPMRAVIIKTPPDKD